MFLVNELREELTKRGLLTTGIKVDLVARLKVKEIEFIGIVVLFVLLDSYFIVL